jgi:hypothetical protein
MLLTLALTGPAASLAHADEPITQFVPSYPTQPIVVQQPGSTYATQPMAAQHPGFGYASGQGQPPGFGYTSGQGQQPGFGCASCQNDPPTGRGWYQRPVGCYKSINCPGCGTLRSELTFAFGSCRRFFGDPCFKSPPPPYPYSSSDSSAPYSHP